MQSVSRDHAVPKRGNGTTRRRRQPRHSLADRFGIVGIVLLRLRVWLHKLRRHQTNRMSETAEYTRPVVGTAAGLDTNRARSLLSKDL